MFGKTGVRSIDEQFRVIDFQTQGEAFFRVRSGKGCSRDVRQDLKLRIWCNLDDLDVESLLEQTIVIRIVHRFDNSAQAFRSKNSQRLAAALRLRRPFQTEKKRGESSHMVEMKMTDPDCVEIGPVEVFLRHAARCVGA